MSLTYKLQEVVRRLFEEEKIDLLIGYEKGTLPRSTIPCLVRGAKEVERLTWGPYCVNNLAKFVIGLPGRIGIVTKGCDVRSLIGLIQENQVKRENMVIIGVVCEGVVNQDKVSEISSKEDEIEMRAELLANKCLSCDVHIPNLYDLLLGDPRKVENTKPIDPYEEIKEIEKLSLEERWEYWREHLSRCIRCYACRQVCPFCYCYKCFVEVTRPQWVWRSGRLSENTFYHLGRAMHLVGRCTNCGEMRAGLPLKDTLK